MSLIDSIISRMGYTKAKDLATSGLLDVMVAKYQESYGIEKPISISAYASAYSADEWVYSCVHAITEASMDAGFKLYRKILKDGKPSKEEVTQHPAIDTLRRVNSHTTEDEFKEQSLLSLELQGDCYWYKAFDSLNIPRELHWMRTDWVKIVPDRDTYIKGYIYDNGIEKVTFLPEEVLHFKYPHPKDFYYGQSPLAAARIAVESNIYSNIYAKNFFKNSSRPDGFLSTDKNLNPDQITRLSKQWEKLFKGYDNAYKTAILEAGMEYKLVGITQKDADFIAQQKNFREKILAIYRVPPVMVNIYEYANYANSQEQRKIFWADVLSKKLNRLAGYLTEFYIRPVWGDDLFIEVDYSSIEVLQESQNEKIDRVIKQVNAALMSPNQGKQVLGYDVVPDPAMDEHYMSMAMVPITGDKNTNNDNAKDNNADNTKSLDFKKKREFKIAQQMTRNRQRRLSAIINEFKDSMNGAFELQGRKLNSAIGRIHKSIDLESKEPLRPFDIEALWTMNAIGEILIKKADNWIKISLLKGIEGARDVTGIDLAFDGNSPRIKNAAENILSKLKSMTDKTSVEELRSLITESFNNKDTVTQLQKNITKKFEGYKGYRSERIARTEAANAYGRSSLEYYKEAGLKLKAWYTMNDGLVAPECMGNQDQGSIDINQSFSSGVMNEPNHVNCRCSVVPVSE